MRVFIIAAASMLLSGCATIVNGSNQSVTVSTDPPGASCRLSRQTETLGAIPITPGSVQVSKSKNDMVVTCEKPGYLTAVVSRSSSFGGATFGNILLGGGVGIIVDAASGANYTYPSEIHVAMAPTAAAAPTASITPPAVVAVAESPAPPMTPAAMKPASSDSR